ncbi:MAG: DNA replication/repair protein RecF [Cellulomonadaceae bacterium]
MYVSHLSLRDFRSYREVDLELEPGINALVGPNGQGKTNLVEAVAYVATLSSHRVPSDTALIRAGAEQALIRTRVVRGERASTVELQLVPGKSNRARINRGSPTRARDVLGILRTVVFAPEDLALVKGDPDGRRRFLDELTVLMAPRMSAVLADYDRVLRQRSALLKSATGAGRRSVDLRTLDVWDGKLAALGAEIVTARHRLVRALSPQVSAAYDEVSAGQGTATVRYRSSLAAALDAEDSPATEHPTPALLEAQLLEVMARLRPKEIERGVCLVGPHRDDLLLVLGDLPAKGYASHGESWSFALALRLGSYRLMTGDGLEDDLWFDDRDDGEPVLILDDVFAELDARRRRRLATLVAGARQVLVTAAVPEDVPDELSGTRTDVMDGTARRVL